MSRTLIMRTDISALRGWLILLLAFASVHPRVSSQSPVTPPLRITYQGYLLGGDGLPLASIAARAYDVVFRIFAEETGGAALWAELQTATVEKGYFSVQLGEGVPIAGVTNPSGGLAAVFTATDATNRYVALSVRGVGANGTDLEIQPRVRLLAAPFAYLAQAAGRLVDGTGADAVVATASGLSFAKPISAVSLSAHRSQWARSPSRMPSPWEVPAAHPRREAGLWNLPTGHCELSPGGIVGRGLRGQATRAPSSTPSPPGTASQGSAGADTRSPLTLRSTPRRRSP